LSSGAGDRTLALLFSTGEAAGGGADAAGTCLRRRSSAGRLAPVANAAGGGGERVAMTKEGRGGKTGDGGKTKGRGGNLRGLRVAAE
jgi:hypothetical protein